LRWRLHLVRRARVYQRIGLSYQVTHGLRAPTANLPADPVQPLQVGARKPNLDCGQLLALCQSGPTWPPLEFIHTFLLFDCYNNYTP
jgi:hypothetical protein